MVEIVQIKTHTQRATLMGCLSLVLLVGCANQPRDFVLDAQRCGQVHRVAVLPFSDGPGTDGVNSGNSMAGFVLDRLIQGNRLEVVERSRLKAIMAELDLQAADLVDPRTAAKVGKLAGVDAVVTGSVSQYNYDRAITEFR